MILKDFLLSLLVIIVRKIDTLVIETKINQGYKLVNYLNVLKSDYIL